MKCLQLVSRRSVILVGVALAGLGMGPLRLAHADGYPAKPVQLVVPFPPGGAVDIVGRTISKKLGDRLGQPIVVENKAGAGTVVGAAYVANAPADGYTLLISSGSTFTVNPALNAKLPYDPVKSYEPVGLVARVPLILLAHRDVPVNNLRQLIAAVQRTPDKFSYGSFGNGTTGHFAAELTWSAAGIKPMHVPYRGSAPAIAVTGATRATQLPDVPTVAESGFPGFSADSWLAVVAPRGLPAEAKAKLHKALAETLADAEIRSKLIAAGLEPSYATGDAVLAQIEDELPRMRAIAQRAQIRAD